MFFLNYVIIFVSFFVIIKKFFFVDIVKKYFNKNSLKKIKKKFILNIINIKSKENYESKIKLWKIIKKSYKYINLEISDEFDSNSEIIF